METRSDTRNAKLDPSRTRPVGAVGRGNYYVFDTYSQAVVGPIPGPDGDTVSVWKAQDAAVTTPDGNPGHGYFELSRKWDVNESLAVTYSIGGSASAGTDYQALSGSATFAAGQTHL